MKVCRRDDFASTLGPGDSLKDSASDQGSDELLRRVADRLKAMGNPTRLKILHALESELSVSDIQARVGGSQANISKHLKVLHAVDLVRSRRDGVTIYYRVADHTVLSVCETVCDALVEQASAELRRIERAREAIRFKNG